GISTVMSLRLFTRAPCTRIMSWLSAACGAGGRLPFFAVVIASALLLDPDHVACRIPQGTVAHPVRLLGGLLDNLDIAGLYPLEGTVEILGRQVDLGVGALGHHLVDQTA